MSAQFQYSLLQYHHLNREELLTVGVLVLFTDFRKIYFLSPDKLSRLRCAFPEAPEKLLRSWLKSFEWQAEKLNKKPDLFAHYDLEHEVDKLVEKFFLPNDSSALQFRKVKSAVQYNDDPSVICKHLQDKFLSIYAQEDEEGHKDKNWLTNEFRKYLKEKNADVFFKKAIKENYVAQFNNREYKFDFAWQNHSFNLVNAISFDVKLPETIQRKAEQYFGKFSLLHSFAEERNARFDVLLAPPSSNKLYSAYDKALEDIRQAGNVKLISENEIRDYAQQTVEEIIFPDEDE